MFRILFVLFAALSLRAQAQSSFWQFQAPYPTAHNLTDVSFVDSLNGWAVGEAGTLLQTRDGGLNWEQKADMDDTAFYKVQFINQQVGWAASHEALLRTRDGGQSWQRIRKGSYTFHFFDQNRGWLSYGGQSVCNTLDGGVTWSNPAPVRDAEGDNVIEMVSPTTVWMATDTASLGSPGMAVYKSTNNGGSWRRMWGVEGSLKYARFFDANNGLVIVERAGIGRTLVMTTENGGLTWKQRGNLSSVRYAYFTDLKHGWAGTGFSSFEQTSDSGRTWNTRVIPPSSGYSLKSVFFANSRVGWQVGNNGMILKSTDGGIAWASGNRNTGIPYSKLQMVTPRVGYTVGGSLAKTTDGGYSWSPLESTQGTGYHTDAHFISEREGWAVGERGVLKKTADGGQTWVNRLPAAEIYLLRVRFFNADTGIAMGGRKLIKTTNGGLTWDTLPFYSESSLISMHFADSRTGWVTGEKGKIYKTADGGQSWQPQASRTRAVLHSVFFTDENRGWIAGNWNTILRTENGGQTWVRTSIDSNSNAAHQWRAVAFSDSLNGWVGAESGHISRTADGGRTWVARPRQESGVYWFFVQDAANVWALSDGITKVGDIPVAARPHIVAAAAQSLIGQVVPNPNQGVFSLDLKTPARVDVLTLDGRRVLALPVQATGTVWLDLSGHRKGLYLIHTTDAHGHRQVRKVAVE